MTDDEDIEALLNTGSEKTVGHAADSSSRIRRALKRVNTNKGQQQTLAFLLVKVWVTVAKVLAPIFAGMAKRHARAKTQNSVNTLRGDSSGNS
jgi:hypothetical protein